MNESRSPILTDDVLRAALTQHPPTVPVDVFRRRLSAGLAGNPQRRPRLIDWPWTPVLPALPPTTARRRVHAFALLVSLALLVALSAAVIGYIGSFRRVPPPFGLAKPGLVAFDSAGHVYVSNADGTNRRQLTFGPASDVQPMFSPDGTKIAYQSLIRSELTGFESYATVELIVMDVDGTHRRTVATRPRMVTTISRAYVEWGKISWSPDGQYLAYTGRSNGQPAIFVARTDGADSTLVGDIALGGQYPAWSPDSARIAFKGGRNDKDVSLYVMNADGAGLRPLIAPQDDATGNVYSFNASDWSPDGRWIAYTKERGTSGSQIMVLEVASGVSRAMSNDTDRNTSPVWSPDGSWLAYSNQTSPSDTRFAIVRPDGSGASVLPGIVFGRPVWSPDGRELLGLKDCDNFETANPVLVIDVATGASRVLPRESSVETDSNEIQGVGSWQRLVK